MSTISQSVEDYLKAIYTLEHEGEGATTNNLAEAMRVSSASATSMMKKLHSLGFVNHTSYKGVSLTPAGTKIALEIIRHHRLLELYLKEIMGYSWDQVHDEAEKLEHHISEQFEDKIAELLDHPTHDPHGDPIPSKDGVVPEKALLRIIDAEIEQLYIIGRVSDQNPELLRYLEKMGLIPGVSIQITEKAPFDGPISLKLEDETHVSIGRKVAEEVYLTRI